MKIYLLQRTDARASEDKQYVECVVIAPSRTTAVRYHPDGKHVFRRSKSGTWGWVEKSKNDDGLNAGDRAEVETTTWVDYLGNIKTKCLGKTNLKAGLVSTSYRDIQDFVRGLNESTSRRR